jgi:hypothetical protein
MADKILGELRLVFFLLALDPIYKEWKGDILSLMVSNLDPWFDLEGTQLLAQSNHNGLTKLLEKGVGRVGYFTVVS